MSSLVILTAVLLSSAWVHAQVPVTPSWIPNAKDRYVYRVEGHFHEQSMTSTIDRSSVDTLTVTIRNVNVFTDSIEVLTDESISGEVSIKRYTFTIGPDTTSPHWLNVTETNLYGTASYKYDFTSGTDTPVNYGSSPTNGRMASGYYVLGHSDDHCGFTGIFASSLRWFYSKTELFELYFIGNDPEHTADDARSYTLINVISAKSSVRSKSYASAFTFVLNAKRQLLLDIPAEHVSVNLIDPLGRIVRAETFEGQSDTHAQMSVADLPDGVYFLNVSSDGFDEVHKVCIVR